MTLTSYRQHVAKYIGPLLGSIRLRDLTGEDIERFHVSLSQDYPGLTPATRQRISATLRAYLRSRERAGAITIDPTRQAEPIKASPPRVKPWEPAQLGRFLDWASDRDVRLTDLIEVAVATGMRRGELLGLRWEDVDLTRGRIVVAQQIQRQGGKDVVGKPKTKAGEARVVDLSASAIGVLRRVLEQQNRERLAWASDYLEHGRVFAWQNGRPYSAENLSHGFRASSPPTTRTPHAKTTSCLSRASTTFATSRHPYC